MLIEGVGFKMLKSHGRAVLAMLAALIAVGSALPLAAQTQPAPDPVVGPPELSDFELPGTRTTPPAQVPPATKQPAPAPKQTTTTPPVASRPAPTGTVTPPASSTTTRPPAAAPATAPALDLPPAPPLSDIPAEPLPTDPALGTGEVPVDDLLPPAAEEQLPVPEGALEGGEEDWPVPPLWIAIGLGALTLIFAFLGLRRSRHGDEEKIDEEELIVDESIAAAALPAAPAAPAAALPPAAAGAPPEPSAAPAAFPAAAPVADAAEQRPWLELVFNPTRAAATPSHTEITFEFALRNIGSMPAHNIRIDVRIFNASDEAAIAEFFASPDPMRSTLAPQPIPPGIESHFRSRVEMPLTDVRAVIVEGRSLFIPVIAFNVTYGWEGGGHGQTSRSYLVGRETETPSDKMAPFRLDLGPRVYRSVGQRQNKLAHVA